MAEEPLDNLEEGLFTVGVGVGVEGRQNPSFSLKTHLFRYIIQPSPLLSS